jgi:hypothetical protein
MGHTRVIFSTSTSAECFTLLKHLEFEDRDGKGCFTQSGDNAVRIYVVWGKAPYFPELNRRIPFPVRVQVHLKTKDRVDELDRCTRETVQGMRSLDDTCQYLVFDPSDGREITTS